MTEKLKQLARDAREIYSSAGEIRRKQSFARNHDLKRLSPGNYALYRRLWRHVIRGNDLIVVDIGANDGWFTNIVYAFEPKASVRAFEPLVSQEKNLRSLAVPGRDYIFYAKAVGDMPGKKVLHESSVDGLSSLRTQIAGAYDHAFDSKITGSYEVGVTTLDAEFAASAKKLLVKIDVQGYEMEVLRGAEKLLRRGAISCIVIELCTREKYAGQALAPEIIDFLAGHGFRIFDLYPFYYEKESGELSEFDAIFVHTKIHSL